MKCKPKHKKKKAKDVGDIPILLPIDDDKDEASEKDPQELNLLAKMSLILKS